MSSTEREINLSITIKGGEFNVDGTGLEFLKNRQVQVLTNNLRRAVKRRRAELRLALRQEEIKKENEQAEKAVEDKAKQKDEIVKATLARIAEKQKAAGANAAGEVNEVNEKKQKKSPPKSGDKSNDTNETES